MTEITGRLSTALADRYRLERHLGEGGMATVYLAHDLKHDRKVAIKVLRAELAAVLGADRFVQEIKTTANLQHPHILPLFDSGEADGFLYYVMPFIEGETLRDKLNRETQLGIEEAVKITTEVADALDYAHRHNVIHRDIKPENILLHDGRPMVADFGIALAVSAAAGGRMTETGLSLGTPHYMSPEQATAEKDLTNRSDIYSLGAVLYEMLTGDPPHTGSTAQQVIMKIVTDEARPVTELRKSVPPNVAATTAKALEKLPADRFESAAALAEALGTPGYVLPSVPTTGHAASARRADWRLLALAAALVVAIGVAVMGWLRQAPPPMVTRFAMGMAPEQRLQILTGQTLAVSPDGSRIVYYGLAESENQLWVRAMDDLNAVPIPGTIGAAAPFFSPDGQSVAYYRRPTPSTLYVVSLAGGPPLALMDGLTYHGSWGHDGYLYVLTLPHPRALARLPASGGPLEILVRADSAANRLYLNPHVLPNGGGVFFTDCDPSLTNCDIRILDLESGENRVIVEGGYRARYVRPGFVVYSRPDGVLLAAAFDQDRLETTGPSTPLLEGLLLHVGGPDFDISQNGTLVYLAGDVTGAQLTWVGRDGVEETIDPNLEHGFSSVALSPEGGRIALSYQGDPEEHLWLYDIDQATLSRLSFQGRTNQRAAWLPDGQRLSFVSNATGQEALHTIRADGSSPPELTIQLERPIWEASWSHDGRWLVFRSGPAGATRRDIAYLEVGVDTTPRTFLATEFDELNPKLSPDGRWLVYVSDESGRDEVYVRPFPGPGGRWQVSTDGGTEPLWAHSGQELFYRSSDGWLMRAEVTTGTSFSVGARTPLFSVARFARDRTHTHYDISSDDQRFLMIRPSEASHEVVVVLNWFTELEERMRAAR